MPEIIFIFVICQRNSLTESLARFWPPVERAVAHLLYLCRNAFIMSPETKKQSSENDHTLLLAEEANTWQLVVWNDEVNTFEWVIDSLMEICHHTYEQAEQCALFIHFRGKYAVKHGDLEELRPMCEALLDRKITATIEEMANA